jgi:hypothetical protein
MDTTSLLAFAKSISAHGLVTISNDFVNPALAVAYVLFSGFTSAQTVMQPYYPLWVGHRSCLLNLM